MEEYSDVRAPQWMDFTKSPSPQLSTPDFFDKVHTMHEREVARDDVCDSTFGEENAENADPQLHSLASSCCEEKAAKAGAKPVLEEIVIKSTPIKVISPTTSRGGKREAAEQFTTYDQVLSEAMSGLKKLEFSCKRLPCRIQESFKTPNNATGVGSNNKLVKSSRSVDSRSLHRCGIQMATLDSAKSRSSTISGKHLSRTSSDSNVKLKKTSVSLSLFKGGDDEDCVTQSVASLEEPHCNSTDSVKRNEAKCDGKEEEKVEEVTRDVKGEEEDKRCDVDVAKDNNEKLDTKEDDKKKPGEEAESKKLTESNNKGQDDRTREEQQEEEKEEDQEIARHTATTTAKSSGATAQPLPKVLTWQNHRRTTFGSVRRLSVGKKYVSMAEAVSRFQNETPKRFRTRSTRDNQVVASSSSLPLTARPPPSQPKPTIPISPALLSKNRTRPVKVLSREEKEALELEEMRKHRIRANPVPRSVLRGPARAPRERKEKDVAEASTASSASATAQPAEKQPQQTLRSGSLSRGDNKGTSRGERVKTTILTVTDADGIVVRREEISSIGVPSVGKSVTRVEPFSFDTRSRDLLRRKQERLRSQQEAARPEFHARPAPSFTKPPTPVSATKQQQQQQPQAAARRQVVPRPFSFDERDKQISKKKEQLVKQVLAEERRSRSFRANPAPVFKSGVAQPAAKSSRLSVRNKTGDGAAENSRSDSRKEPGEAAAKKSEPTKATGSGDDADQATKRSAPSLPKRGHSFELNTDKRARERREFEEKVRRKEMEEEAARREKERRERERDRLMRAEMRKLAEVRARPMPAFKPPLVVRQVKPLTNPQSPAFMSKLRSKQQQQQQQQQQQ